MRFPVDAIKKWVLGSGTRAGAPRKPSASRAGGSAGRTPGLVGGAFLAVLGLVALFAPVVARHDPQATTGRPYEAPSISHLLGTNDVGQDLFAQLIYGARVSLAIGLLSALVAVFIGLAVALVAGYYRGRVEAVLMRIVDLTLAFPFLVLAIVLAAFFGRGMLTMVVVIGAVMWARPARVLRSQVIKIREFQHVVSARAMGASPLRVIGRHLLPRLSALTAAQFVRAANVAVLIEASLSFLGLGDPNRVSWGTMLYFANTNSAFLTDAWLWWILPPGLALTVAIVGLAFLGYAVEEWADPRLARPATWRTARRQGGARGAGRHTKTIERTPGAVLEVRDLTVQYEESVRAVDGVNLTVGRGQIVGLVGESGSGKSTLAMALLGLLYPPARVVEGETILDGRDLQTLRRAELARMRGREVSLIPQAAMNALNPAYTVHRQVAEAAALTRDEDAAAVRAGELLELVGIPRERHGAYPHEFSGGMRQRAIIAMALANEPSLLVADEPTTGLDVVTQARILRLLVDLRDRLGVAILLISHDLPLVARVADDLLVMYEGRIVESGSRKEVVDNPTHPYTRALRRAFPGLHGPRQPLSSTTDGPSDLPNHPPAVRSRSAQQDGLHPSKNPRSRAILELHHVSNVFQRQTLLRRDPPVVAIDDVSLSVMPGEILALVGESGAGKSTVGRTILGLRRPDTGRILFEGQDLTDLSEPALRKVRRRMHLILQDPYESLHPGMRVRALVAEPLAIAGLSAGERGPRVVSALEEVGLAPASRFMDRFPHELSGGQRQRVPVARALVGRPRLVVADEPTSMLDAPLRASVLELIMGMRDRLGMAFVFITHDLATARRVSDRIAVMYRGRIIECEETERLIEHPRHEYTKTLLRASEGVL